MSAPQKEADYFVEGLALLFIGLKLLGKIDWSWWWVLSPIWGALALFVVLTLLVRLLGGGRE